MTQNTEMETQPNCPLTPRCPKGWCTGYPACPNSKIPWASGAAVSPERVRVHDEKGERHDIVARTKSGRILTEADILALAEEAEEGES